MTNLKKKIHAIGARLINPLTPHCSLPFVYMFRADANCYNLTRMHAVDTELVVVQGRRIRHPQSKELLAEEGQGLEQKKKKKKKKKVMVITRRKVARERHQMRKCQLEMNPNK